jgi:hypothetical protein
MFPRLVTGNLDQVKIDPSKVQIEIPQETTDQQQETAPPDFGSPKPAPESPADDLQKQFGAPK